MHDVDENEPVPFWRGTSKESLADESIAIPLLYSIQINLKVFLLHGKHVCQHCHE